MLHVFWFSLLFSFNVQASEYFCAQKYSDLSRSPSFKDLQVMMPENGIKGFVNGTKGSYFFIRSNGSDLVMTFLTTGIFDLYGIRREGAIQFCEREGKLFILGLGYEEELVIKDSQILWGGGTLRQTFREGPVPEVLLQKHDLSGFPVQ